MEYKKGEKYNNDDFWEGAYVPEYPGCKGCIHAKEDFIYNGEVSKYGYNFDNCKIYKDKTGKPITLSCNPGKTKPKETCKYYTKGI